ncbi:MAG: hypothetical protein EBQ97_06550, partial [Bacteroidetes bacterium]|nr:hypothetical protein [Bacteroidota bacterium]
LARTPTRCVTTGRMHQWASTLPGCAKRNLGSQSRSLAFNQSEKNPKKLATLTWLLLMNALLLEPRFQHQKDK